MDKKTLIILIFVIVLIVVVGTIIFCKKMQSENDKRLGIVDPNITSTTPTKKAKTDWDEKV